MIGTAEEGTRLREELRSSLYSLSFGAAYKVLDILVEHIARANNPSVGRLSFIDKNRILETRPQILPPPLNFHLELWSRLATLYSIFQEARHAVVHRRCQLTNSGDLEIYDDKKWHAHTITSCEIDFFVAAVQTIAGLVINTHDDNRRTRFATWYLNKLQSRHCLPSLDSINPYSYRWLLERDLTQLNNGYLRFEVAQARKIIENQPKPSLWDLRLHAGKQIFAGFWEEVEDQSLHYLDFHPTMLPTWLSKAQYKNV